MQRVHQPIRPLFTISFALAVVACGDLPPPRAFSTPASTVGFSAGPDLAVGRFLHASVALPNGRVVVAGGFIGPGEEAQRSVEVFTPNVNLWASGPPMQVPRYAHKLVLLSDGHVLAMGGQNSTGYLASAERWDVQTPSSAWQQAPAMREPRIHFTATTITSKNTVLVAGGISDIFPNSEWLDATAEQWLPQAAPLPMIYSRSYHASAILQGGKVLVTGGLAQIDMDPEADVLDDAEVFDSATDTWSVTTRLNVPRATHTLTALRDGRVIAIGGTTHNGVVLHSAEVFDPMAGTWEEILPMANARTGHQATLLVGGRRLLVTGGYGAVPDPVAMAEILDLETMQWSSAGNLVAPRFWHTAHVVESDGRVLVVGGVDGVINGAPPTVMKTEIFTPPCASNLECPVGYYCAVEGVCTVQSN